MITVFAPTRPILKPAVTAVLAIFLAIPGKTTAQQSELSDVTVATAVGNLAYSAIWVAEQLKYFEQEGVRAKITVAGGGPPCQSAVVGRSTHFCLEPRGAGARQTGRR